MIYFLAISKMLAGIGIFLLGMNFLEDALRRLGGRRLKLFLRNNTTSNVKSAVGGALISGVLQGSSVVNLMVLAFVGARIIALKSALAISLGAGLGSTLNGWIVATVGFGFNIDLFTLPILGVSGLVLASAERGTRVYHWSRLAFGFGALFLGLEFMKSSFAGIASAIDFRVIRDYPWFIFILTGFVLTAVVQSSGATTAIILSALYVNAISLYDGFCVVLGGEVGTTVKLLIASFRGLPEKKRVALGSFAFNAILIGIVMLALDPIHTVLINLENPLVALVTFHSLLNFAALLIFLPFLNRAEKFLHRFFTDDQAGARYLKAVPRGEGDLALDALEKETHRYLLLTLDLHRQAFGLVKSADNRELDDSFRNKRFHEKYDYLKLLHGEILTYFIGMDKEGLSPAERERAEQIISAVRNSMFSAKSTKDSHADIEQLRGSSSATKYQYYLDTRRRVEEFDIALSKALSIAPGSSLFEDMAMIYKRVQQGYSEELKKLYQLEAHHQVTEIDISTLINFNREFFACYKAMVWAAKDFLLEKNQAAYFAELPGFIR